MAVCEDHIQGTLKHSRHSSVERRQVGGKDGRRGLEEPEGRKGAVSKGNGSLEASQDNVDKKHI